LDKNKPIIESRFELTENEEHDLRTIGVGPDNRWRRSDHLIVREISMTVRMPDEIKQWLLEQARYNGATLGAEVSRSCR
jgi:hypothetical protein